MKYEVQDSNLDYSKVNFGSIIIMEDSLWTVILADDSNIDECLLVSLKTNQVVESFVDLGDVISYLKSYKDSVVKILSEDEFKIKVIEV